MRWQYVVLVTGLVAIGSCTWLLDWHLHDSKVRVGDKEVEVEGEEARDHIPEEEEEWRGPPQE